HADRLAALLGPLLLDQLAPQEVAHELAPVAVATLGAQVVERGHQLIGERDRDPRRRRLRHPSAILLDKPRRLRYYERQKDHTGGSRATSLAWSGSRLRLTGRRRVVVEHRGGRPTTRGARAVAAGRGRSTAAVVVLIRTAHPRQGFRAAAG